MSSDSWTESNLTWRNQPATGATLSCQNVAATGWISFDVTSFVSGELTGDKVVSLTLQEPAWQTAWYRSTAAKRQKTCAGRAVGDA